MGKFDYIWTCNFSGLDLIKFGRRSEFGCLTFLHLVRISDYKHFLSPMICMYPEDTPKFTKFQHADYNFNNFYYIFREIILFSHLMLLFLNFLQIFLSGELLSPR